jgi:ferrous iron transport protein B
MKIADNISEKIFTRTPTTKKGFISFIDKLTTHPVWGFPFLFLVLFGLYEFVGKFGAGTLVDFIVEIIFGEYLNPLAERIITTFIPVSFIQELLVGHMG